MLLQIDHATRYDYHEPVKLGQHRLMLRPLEGHDIQIRSSTLGIDPSYRIRWMHDTFQNSVATVDFLRTSNHLLVESQVVVKQYNINPFDFELEPRAEYFPFTYTQEEMEDLVPFLKSCHPEDDAAIREWVRPYLSFEGRGKTVDFLLAINRAVPRYFSYARREEIGVQTPGETLRMRSGSCRDFAFLFMEMARAHGLAARFVSGYLLESEKDASERTAESATHAWTEIYLPGAGWKGLDPTNGILASDPHVRVAVGRLPAQAAPVTGSFIGLPSSFDRMTVEVKVRRLND